MFLLHWLNTVFVRCGRQGLDLELQATALARADMRAKTPSAKVAARAVRSLKKKIARVKEWERMREKGQDLSADQVGFLIVRCT